MKTRVPIVDMIITGHNNPRKRLKKVKKIVVHWTASTGAGGDADAIARYFQNTDRDASAQYEVDDKKIVRAIEDGFIAWGVGAKSYTKFGESLRVSGFGPNYSTVSIEMCVNSDSAFKEMELNCVSLVVMLLLKYGLKPTDVCRHFDITGKDCPHFFIADKDWKEFLAQVKASYDAAKAGEPMPVLYTIDEDMKLTAAATIRKGPMNTYQEVGKYAKGDIVRVLELTDGYYRTNKGWFRAELAKHYDEKVPKPAPLKLEYAKGTVNTDVLNIRSTNEVKDDNKVGTYTKGTVITLLEEDDDWYRTDKGWVAGTYVTRLDTRETVVTTTELILFTETNGGLVENSKIPVGSTVIYFYKENMSGKDYFAVNFNGIKGFVKAA